MSKIILALLIVLLADIIMYGLVILIGKYIKRKDQRRIMRRLQRIEEEENETQDLIKTDKE